MRKDHQRTPATSGRTLPLPKFVIARRPSGRLSIRELKPGDDGQAIVRRLRHSTAFSIVWLAAAFQGATAAASEAPAP